MVVAGNRPKDAAEISYFKSGFNFQLLMLKHHRTMLQCNTAPSGPARQAARRCPKVERFYDASASYLHYSKVGPKLYFSRSHLDNKKREKGS